MPVWLDAWVLMKDMSSALVALSSEQRSALEREFLAFLAERDGAFSEDDEKLPRRRLCSEQAGQRSEDLLFVETLKRFYAGERFTVDLAADKLRRSGNPVDGYMAREERHHTELLASLIRTQGHAVPVLLPLLHLAAVREPLLAALLPERSALMRWTALASISNGSAFLPALLDPSSERGSP